MNRSCLGAALALTVLVAGCKDREDRMSGPAPPPAALIAPVRESMSLDERLAVLERELAAALAGRLEGDAVTHMIRAEAVTDRLLEAQIPVRWMDEGYLVESRLRQIQALADRIVAQIRRGEPRAAILAEVRRLHADVVNVRAALRHSSGRQPPVPLDSLLRPRPEEAGEARARAPQDEPRPRPPGAEPELLGVPVPDNDSP